MLKSEVNYALGPYAYAVPLMETMGDRIRALRESQRLSQEAVGKIIGISGASISQWENGTTTGIKPDNFLRFCAYFSADPYWVAFGADGDPKASPSGRFRRASLPPPAR
jgi:transcriptional regulator with XRE-family HTH domain